MPSILPFDELNRFADQIRQRFASGKERLAPSDDYEDILDEMFDLFLLAYAMGNTVTNENLSYNYTPTMDEVMEVVDAKVAGKTWRERAKEYFGKAENGEINVAPGQSGTENQDTESGVANLADALIRIVETETHRIANTSALNTAKKAGATKKTWATMLDERVRSTHDYLEGMSVPIDEDFYTYDGDHASAPGLFDLAENNVNCRCELIFS